MTNETENIETPRQAWVRIQERRTRNAIKSIGIVGSARDLRHYEYDAADVELLEDVLKDEVDKACSRLREGFKQEELFSFPPQTEKAPAE